MKVFRIAKGFHRLAKNASPDLTQTGKAEKTQRAT